MKSNDDLELNAYIDGELSTEQQAELLESMRNDPELARQACELGHLKAQLRLAYATPPRPQPSTAGKVRASWQAIAASLALLAVGLISGWVLHDNAPGWSTDANRFVVLDAQGRGQAPARRDRFTARRCTSGNNNRAGPVFRSHLRRCPR